MFNKAEIEKYFLAEKSAALWVMIFAVVLFVGALIIWVIQKNDTSKGMFFPFVLFLIIAFAFGYGPYKKSDAIRKSVIYAFDMNPSKLQQDELPRVQKLKKIISLRMIADIIFLVAGGVFLFLHHKNGSPISFGLGTGLITIAIIALLFDYPSYLRLFKYLEGIKLLSLR